MHFADQPTRSPGQFLCGIARLLRELRHRFGNHAKRDAGIAGPRRFDLRVQGEDAGLAIEAGDVLDRIGQQG